MFDSTTARRFVLKSQSARDVVVDRILGIIIKKIKIAASLGFTKTDYQLVEYSLDPVALLIDLCERLHVDRGFHVKMNKNTLVLLIRWD